MKKVFLLGAMMVFLTFTTIAQNKTNPASPQKKATPANVQNKATMDSLIYEVQVLRKELYEADSINKLILDGIYRNIDKPRYKMYQTENNYNLLKLDTRIGRVWQVQYRMSDVQASVVSINFIGIVF